MGVAEHPWADWLKSNEEFLLWAGIASAVMFVGTLIVVPIIITRMGEDYFMPERRQSFATLHPVLRIIGLVVKNVSRPRLRRLGDRDDLHARTRITHDSDGARPARFSRKTLC